jgi:hypothetical protein
MLYGSLLVNLCLPVCCVSWDTRNQTLMSAQLLRVQLFHQLIKFSVFVHHFYSCYCCYYYFVILCCPLRQAFSFWFLSWNVNRDSSVNTATGYGLDSSWIEFRWGRDFLHPSRLALGTAQPPVQWVPGYPGVKRPGRGVHHPPHLALKLKKE